MKNNICSGSLPLVVEQCVTKVLSECKENEKDLQALSFETIHMQVSDQIELERACQPAPLYAVTCVTCLEVGQAIQELQNKKNYRDNNKGRKMTIAQIMKMTNLQ